LYNLHPANRIGIQRSQSIQHVGVFYTFDTIYSNNYNKLGENSAN
jgi:hypothetical protein